MTRGITSGYDTIGPDHHAELESYNESMRERDLICEFCGSTDPAESAHLCLRCAHVILEIEDAGTVR